VDVLTYEAVDQVFHQFGADDALLENSSEMNSTNVEFDIEFNLYGLLSLASVWSQLPLRCVLHCQF
jgi:hypothetical protein